MSPKKQRYAIAEACGWKRSGVWDNFWISPSGAEFREEDRKSIPDYLNDLNAMHEAERILDGYMMLKYASELLAVIGGGSGCFSHIHATAAQRSEAFLRTLGKWEESK